MLRKITSAVAATLLATLALVPATAGTLVVKDGNSATQSLRTVVNSDSSQTYVHALQDTTGTLVDPATKQLQQQLISTLGSPLQAGGTVTLGGGTNAIGSVTITGTPTVSCSNCSGGGGGGTVPTGTAGSPNAAVLSVQGITNGTALPVTGAFYQATQPVSAATLPLPTGAATDSNLTSLRTALGSPFQAGGSIANTSFGATQSGTWNITNVTGTVSLPTGASTAANQSAANASLATIAAGTTPSVFYNGATGAASALASSATFTGAARDSGIVAGTASGLAYFNAFFLADQAGTARVDCSNDGTTWYTCATGSVTVATPLILTVPIMTRYHRAVVVNGTTAETYLWVNTSYTGA